ncbi:MAG: class I SAM-dependent methyltransferase [Nitrospiraceae bacterium]
MQRLAIGEENVIRTISPNDEMYAGDRGFSDWYWYVGRSALDVIDQCLHAAKKPVSDIQHILDLPCGHGRVLRYLKAAFPTAEITACDVLRDGVEFCAETFAAKPVYSRNEPEQIELPLHQFDLIWVGSLFTHLNAERWPAFLRRLVRSLRKDGVLVFTTHGRYVYHRMKGLEDAYEYCLPYWSKTVALYEYERTGFGFGDYQNRQYGISLSAPGWVCSLVEQCGLRCIHFQERGWHDIQDAYACVPDLHPKDSESAIARMLYLRCRVRDLLKPVS